MDHLERMDEGKPAHDVPDLDTVIMPLIYQSAKRTHVAKCILFWMSHEERGQFAVNHPLADELNGGIRVCSYDSRKRYHVGVPQQLPNYCFLSEVLKTKHELLVQH
jgi:hypothetical protein